MGGAVIFNHQPSPLPGRNPRNEASPQGVPSPGGLAWAGSGKHSAALGTPGTALKAACTDKPPPRWPRAGVPRKGGRLPGLPPLWADTSTLTAAFIECQFYTVTRLLNWHKPLGMFDCHCHFTEDTQAWGGEVTHPRCCKSKGDGLQSP